MRDRGLDIEVDRYEVDERANGLLMPALIISFASLVLGVLLGCGLLWMLGLA